MLSAFIVVQSQVITVKHKVRDNRQQTWKNNNHCYTILHHLPLLQVDLVLLHLLFIFHHLKEPRHLTMEHPGQYQQQPVGVAPHYQQQPITVPPTQTVVLTNNVNFGETPVQLRCPNCQKDVITNIHHESGLLTWIGVGVLCILSFWLCCWLPFLFDPLKDVVHTCPNCQYTCGIDKKIG